MLFWQQSVHAWVTIQKESRICSGSCLGQELKPENQKTIFPKRIFGKMVFWFSLVFFVFLVFHFFWFFQLPDLKKQKNQGKRWFLQQNYSKTKKNSREKMVFVRTWINKWFKNQKKTWEKDGFLDRILRKTIFFLEFFWFFEVRKLKKPKKTMEKPKKTKKT